MLKQLFIGTKHGTYSEKNLSYVKWKATCDHLLILSRATLDNTLIYVVVLSCVDFGVCLSLPFTVIDQILGFWMFGMVPCKLHAVFENFGKILSALILTAMSFDRYAGVCHPQKKILRSRIVAIIILLGLAAYALITLCPLLLSFTSREIVMFARETGYKKITRMKIEKCTVDIDSFWFTAFTIYQFVLCYCTPLVLIAFFYSKLLRKLREHARAFKSSHIPLMRISLYTLAVACFYFLCWTPFWMATVFAVYLENTGICMHFLLNIIEIDVFILGDSEGTVPPLFVYIMYFIHALPFTNSAINWILYGALNGQLQQRYRGARTTKTFASTNTIPVNNMKPPPAMNGSTTFINHPTEALCSTVEDLNDDGSEMVDVRLLSTHEPTYL
uniref:G_PROTEIN_RECEP_F1_2 domain-containing protein n=1 Tax=Heterorhabditis bacteriophora TaxID=37862 RepID=A0A1I7XBB9_HETBA